MPVIDIPLDDPREPGRTTTAYAYGPSLRIDAANPEDGMIRIGLHWYATPAAAMTGGAIAAESSITLSDREYRNWVRANPDLYLATIASIDAEIQARHGGTIVPATLPAFAADPFEPEPEPDPEPEPEA